MDSKNKIVCHDINGNKEEVDSSVLTFRPSVYGILIENNKVLLSKQWDGYDFPGGKIEINETIEQTLMREFWEETGIKVELLKPIFCKTSFFHANYSKKTKSSYHNCPLIYFLVKKVGGEITKENISNDERDYIEQAEWIAIEKVANIIFYNSVDSEKIIKKALNN